MIEISYTSALKRAEKLINELTEQRVQRFPKLNKFYFAEHNQQEKQIKVFFQWNSKRTGSHVGYIATFDYNTL